jgi:ribosomal protein L29
MNLSELRSQSKEELAHRAAELAEEIRALATGIATATFRKSHEITTLKKERAQILTVLQETGTITRH